MADHVEHDIYSVEVKLCATAYIRAESEEQADAIAAALKDCSPTILDHEGGVSVSGAKYESPDLPAVSLSPAMTIHGLWEDPAADPLTQQAVAFIEKIAAMAEFEAQPDPGGYGDGLDDLELLREMAAELDALIAEAGQITGKVTEAHVEDAIKAGAPASLIEGDQQQYRVKWEIDVTAASPRDAAQQAFDIQRDVNSTATVFDVETKADAWLIDLSELEVA